MRLEVVGGEGVVTARRAGPAGKALGLIGRRHVEHALVLERCRAVHGFGVLVPLDLAFYRSDPESAEMVVVRTARLRAWIGVRWCRAAEGVIEAGEGQLTAAGIAAGTCLACRREAGRR